MKLITRNTDYAIRALAYMAGREKDLVSAAELVKRLKIPRQFLRGILQELGRKGFVKSYKGVGGGFVLARRPSSIYVSGIAEVFQGPWNLSECLFKKSVCPNKGKCLLGKKIDSVTKYAKSEIGSLSIADLINDGGLNGKA